MTYRTKFVVEEDGEVHYRTTFEGSVEDHDELLILVRRLANRGGFNLKSLLRTLRIMDARDREEREDLPEPGIRCGMKDCDQDAIKILEISEHPDLMAAMGLPEKIVKLPCCLEHTLKWEIGWLFGEHGIGVTPRLVGELVFRALAEAGERMRDAMI